MNKIIRYAFICAFLGFAVTSFAQSQLDKIVYKNGQEVLATVLKSSPKDSFILIKDSDGIQNKVDKYLIDKVLYSTGEEEVFPDAVAPEDKQVETIKTDKSKTKPHVLIGINASIPFSGAYGIIPLGGSVEIPIVSLGRAGFICIGAKGGYARQILGAAPINATITQMSAEAVVGYHIPVHSIDFHILAGGGLYHRTSTVYYYSIPEVKNEFGSSLALGVSYYFIPAIGLTADFSLGSIYPKGAITLGVTFGF